MIWLAFYVLVLVFCFILNFLGLDGYYLSFIFVSLSILVTICLLNVLKIDRKIKIWIFLSFAIRIIAMFIDLYIYRLPHAASDDEAFYRVSLLVFDNPSYLFVQVSRGFYPKFLYLFYIFIGTNRIGIQFTNVLISLMSIMVLIKIFEELKVSNKLTMIAVIVLSLTPNFIFLNSILRRESIIALLTYLSILYMAKWYNSSNISQFVISNIFIILASIFHSAMIFIVPINMAVFMLFDKKSSKLKIRGNNFIKMVFLVIVIGLFSWYYISNFKSKFSSFTTADALYEEVSKSRGGSAYLTNMNIQNFYQLLYYSPFKFIYFLFSPMPWNFRGLYDISSFLLDSSLYLFLFYLLLKNKKSGFSKVMMYYFFIITLVFALGTFTSGTAIRHRYTILPFLLISVFCMLNDKEEKVNNEENKY